MHVNIIAMELSALGVPEEELRGKGVLVFGENYLYLGSRIGRFGSWEIWLKHRTLLTPQYPLLAFPGRGTHAKMERIAIASAWRQEGDMQRGREKLE